MVTGQAPVAVESPPPPPKADPVLGGGVKVTLSVVRNALEQVGSQLIPLGELVTVPLPFPFFDTVSVLVGRALNVAVTDRAWSMVTVQVPVELVQAPLQPANSEVASGVA